MKKLVSLTIFFPFYNDEKTVERQIRAAYRTGKKIAQKLEVIAIHGGASRDKTLSEIRRLKKIFPDLTIVNKANNKEGYAVIKHGFYRASSKWIFYTDGDAQYHLENDLPKLVAKQVQTGTEVINGYKKRRSDNMFRVIAGEIYRALAKQLFRLPIRDVDCDCRLIRASVIKGIKLRSHDASILPELIKALELKGAKFAEIPVTHYPREYGVSNYSVWSLFKEKLIGDLKLYFYFKRHAEKEKREFP